MKHLAVCVFVLYLCVVQGKQLPSFVTKCKRSDPNLKTCVKEQIQKFVPHMVNAVPGVRLPKIEPLKLLKLDLLGPGLNATLTDVSVYGVVNLKIADVDVDIKESAIYLHLIFPFINIVSDYSLVGKIGLIELNSSGKFTINMTNAAVDFRGDGDFKEKNNQHYIYFERSTTENATVEAAHLYFNDLVKGNPMLTETVNKIVSEEGDAMEQYIKPLLKSTLNSVLGKIMDDLTHDFSVEELYQ